MQISNNTSKQNFNGTFRIKPNEVKAKLEIPALFTQGRQIFYDILEKGDEVIVVRNNYDKRIGEYIKTNKIKDIEYYPEINTKSGLDSEEPEKLLTLIKYKTTQIITDLNEMFSVIAKQKRAHKPSKSPISNNEIEKISNALRLNIENPQITSTIQSTVILDKEKKRTIEVIMKNKGNSYVYVKPDSISEDCIRCIIDGKGNIMKSFDTPDDIIKFSRIFNKLKNEKINLLKDK